MARRKYKSHQCNNCGHQFNIEPEFNNYCPNCGQENHNPRQPIIHYVYELLESTLHLDSKTWYTLRVLLFQPGTISRDYLANIRARYTPPIRLFIFSLALFILCLNMAQNSMVKKDFESRNAIPLQEQMNSLSDTSKIIFSNPFFTGQKIYYSVAELKELKEVPAGRLNDWLKNHNRSTGFIHCMELRLVKHNIETPLSVLDYQQHLIRIHYWVIILMLPFTASLIFIFFHRKGLLYYDTVVISFHFYAVGFLVGIVFAIAAMFIIQFSLLKDTTIILPADMVLCLFINYLPAHKKIFQLSWPSTIVRALSVSVFNIIIQVSLFWIIAGFIG